MKPFQITSKKLGVIWFCSQGRGRFAMLHLQSSAEALGFCRTFLQQAFYYVRRSAELSCRTPKIENPSTSYRIGKPTTCKNTPNIQNVGSPEIPLQIIPWILLAPKSLHAENIFWGINLCNVIDYICIVKFSRELICVMQWIFCCVTWSVPLCCLLKKSIACKPGD